MAQDQTTKIAAQTGQTQEPSGAFLLSTDSKAYPINKAVVSIGRSIENDIQIDDAYVSRAHGQIRCVNNLYVYFDLGSSSGSKVNGETVKQQILTQGDLITVGKTSLIFAIEEELGSGTTPTMIG